MTAIDTEIAELERFADAPRRLAQLGFRRLHLAQRAERRDRVAETIADDPTYPARLAAARAELAAAEVELAPHVAQYERPRRVGVNLRGGTVANVKLAAIVSTVRGDRDKTPAHLAAEARRNAAWGALNGRHGLERWPMERLLHTDAPPSPVRTVTIGPDDARRSERRRVTAERLRDRFATIRTHGGDDAA